MGNCDALEAWLLYSLHKPHVSGTSGRLRRYIMGQASIDFGVEVGNFESIRSP